AGHPEQADFAPEPVTPADVRRWTGEAIVRADHVLDTLAQRDAVREADRALVEKLVRQRDTLNARLSMLPPDIGGSAIRIHGDFRLEQMLIAKDDIFIIGFEGNAGLPLAERRRKAAPARDVACLMRSIDYSVVAAFDRALRVAPDDQGRLAAALGEWRARA